MVSRLIFKLRQKFDQCYWILFYNHFTDQSYVIDTVSPKILFLFDST